MTLEKPKRHVDQELLARLRNEKCIFCGSYPPNEVHHLKSKKSGGPDEKWNLITVDRQCHTEVHKRGLNFMMNKYLHAGAILTKMGWSLDFTGRMRHNAES